MYSGTTIHTKSGRIMGVHQKIDRVARRHLQRRIELPASFPTIKEILHFEGANGPDGLKRKSPGKDEPWHFIDTREPLEASGLGSLIHDHIDNLATALRTENRERAAFEAAWLAHAIVDGLTPAHHYPLEEKLIELRGEGLEGRNSKRKKLVIVGSTKRQTVRHNWEFWGAKGVMTTHIHFEFGVASAISTMRFDTFSFSRQMLDRLRDEGFDALFNESMRTVASMGMYEEFSQKGWTRHLASETKNTLVPAIVCMVMLGWMTAIGKAEAVR